jgi:lactoylglutathione lyase
MDLGAFSVSLTVKDLAVSRAFYEKLGFEVTGGAEEHNYLVLVNRGAVIGLFQGMFETNILTFNPGLGGTDMKQLEEFTDVREIQRVLREEGIELTEEADESASGPAHIAFLDPDGNPILIDQFF